MSFDIEALFKAHPPIWKHRNKQVVYNVACPPGSKLTGQLDYSRWGSLPLPPTVDLSSALDRLAERPGFFDYAPEPDLPRAVEWHVNFADPHLFFGYGSGLFAQDEMQATEHPALGALLEALQALKLNPFTVESHEPTPVLVMGAPRCCQVRTDPNELEGRPGGLYGNAFSMAPAESVRRATTRIDPPTISHVIAMAAPAHGWGPYTLEEIRYVLVTAYTAFRASLMESRRRTNESSPVVVHSGFWGCGAFGGNRVLMVTLQLLAATMAGLNRLVVHTGGADGDEALRDVRVLIEKEWNGHSVVRTDKVIEGLRTMGFKWGVGDGN